MAYEAADAWSRLAPDYEAARGRDDSLDRLLDWPCQRELIGDVGGRSVLDLGCGSGAKAIQLANEGGRRVVGVDISGPFIEALKSQSTPAWTTWIQADIEHLGDIGQLAGQTFDIITVLCSAMGSDRTRTLRAIAELLTPDPSALVVLYMAHPLRFSLQRSLKEARPLGQTYFDRTPFSYRSHWNPQITLTDHPKTFTDVINAITSAGFFIELSREPELAPALATEFPHKRAWLDENVGGWGLRLRRLPNVPAAPPEFRS